MCSAGSNGPTSSSMPEPYKGPAARASGTPRWRERAGRPGRGRPVAPGPRGSLGAGGAGQEALDGLLGGALAAQPVAVEGAVAVGGAGRLQAQLGRQGPPVGPVR